ncbi:DUF4349 domain-containing protein, partial [Streptomyces bambusae]
PAPAPAAPSAAAPGAPSDGRAPAAVRPHVVRTASLSVESPDAQGVLSATRKAAEDAGGYVGDETTERAKNGTVASTMTLRVPSERFDAVLGALEGSGKLLSRKVEAQDVTEKVADVDSRVRSAQASVVRVREMMEKASALSDVVMLESELSRRQSDLESLLAQQTALKDRTSLGTITLRVTEPAPVAQDGGKKKEKEPTFSGAFRGGVDAFATLLKWVSVAVGAVLPFALVGGVATLLWRWSRRFRQADRGGARPVAQVSAQPQPTPDGHGAAPAAVPTPRPEPTPTPTPDPDPDPAPDATPGS